MVSRPWNILPVKIPSHMWYNLIVPSPTKKILTKTHGGKNETFYQTINTIRSIYDSIEFHGIGSSGVRKTGIE